MTDRKSSHAERPLHWLREGRGSLAGLHQHTRRLRQLTGRLQEQLPAELAGRWLVARVDQAELVIVADSPLWASQLRYLGRNMLKECEQLTGVRPQRLQVKVAEARQAAAPHRATLSAQAGENLRQAAAGCPDQRLRQALLRLARRSRDRE